MNDETPITPILVPFKNAADVPVTLAPIGGPDRVEPGEVVMLPIEMIAPGRKDNGSRMASTIEQCVPQMRPVDPEFEKEWLKVPAPLPPVSRIVSLAPRAPTAPAGVQAMREAAKKSAAAAVAAKKAKA